MGEPPTSAARSAASPRPSASPSQPIVDLSPIKRSASSLTPQSHLEVELRDYDLEHAGQSPVGPGQEEERVHHHHHHHRCHRRRDKDREKKHRSLEKAASVQPGSTTDPSADGFSRERARERDRSRPHERRHHSSAGEKQRYYSCERYGSREPCQARSAGPSRSTSPGEGQDSGPLKQQVSGAVKVGPPTGTSTAGRGRRQLPQTPLTPRPGVAFKTASSSALPGSAAVAGHQARLSRGLSEHDRHPVGHSEAPLSVTCMGSDPNLNRQHLDSSRQALLEESEDFQDAVSSHGGGRFARTAAASQRGAAEAATATAMQGRAAGVPNGYHFTLGVSPASGSGSRGTLNLREREEDDWC